MHVASPARFNVLHLKGEAKAVPVLSFQLNITP
jgi:hypothetical protein